MSRKSEAEAYLRSLPPDGSFLTLDPETETFFKEETGITDSNELREHIIKVQEEAYEVFPYPCIRGFRFAKLKIAKMTAYPRAFELLKNRPDAIFLDIGCCVGTEIRKVIHDGWPISQTIATDLEAGFWDAGHKLFRTTPETYPAKFLAGDAFNDAHLCPTAPVLPDPPPSVASVNTLTELRGHISVIHASSFFHLFNEEEQFELAKRIGSLLDVRPGSIIFGSHAGLPYKGQRQGFIKSFSHSPQSWTELWEEQIFEKGQVKVTTTMVEVDIVAEKLDRVLPTVVGTKPDWLFWSVERL